MHLYIASSSCVCVCVSRRFQAVWSHYFRWLKIGEMARVALACRVLWNETKCSAAWTTADLRSASTQVHMTSFTRLFPCALRVARHVIANCTAFVNLRSLAKHMCHSVPSTGADIRSGETTSCSGATTSCKDLMSIPHLDRLELLHVHRGLLYGADLWRLFPRLVHLRLELRREDESGTYTVERLQTLLERFPQLQHFTYCGPLSETGNNPLMNGFYSVLQLPARLESFVCCATNDGNDDDDDLGPGAFFAIPCRVVTVSDRTPARLRAGFRSNPGAPPRRFPIEPRRASACCTSHL
jgi:hypothetical protein